MAPATASELTVTSASTKTRASPPATRAPSLRARATPPWHGRRTTTSANLVASSNVSSSDPSQTTTSSAPGGAAPRMERRHASMVVAADAAGTTNETSRCPLLVPRLSPAPTARIRNRCLANSPLLPSPGVCAARRGQRAYRPAPLRGAADPAGDGDADPHHAGDGDGDEQLHVLLRAALTHRVGGEEVVGERRGGGEATGRGPGGRGGRRGSGVGAHGEEVRREAQGGGYAPPVDLHVTGVTAQHHLEGPTRRTGATHRRPRQPPRVPEAAAGVVEAQHDRPWSGVVSAIGGGPEVRRATAVAAEPLLRSGAEPTGVGRVEGGGQPPAVAAHLAPGRPHGRVHGRGLGLGTEVHLARVGVPALARAAPGPQGVGAGGHRLGAE